MRILQLHNLHESRGGADDVLDHDGHLLRDAGHDVEAYTLASAADMGLSPIRAGAKAVWNQEACRALEQRILRFKPDVVHVHTPYPLMSPAVFRTAHRMGVPAVATLHSYRYSCIAATCVRDGHICEDCVGKRLKLSGIQHRCYHDSLGASVALTASLVLHRHIGTFHHSVWRFLALTEFSKRLLARDGIPGHKILVKPNSVSDPGPRDADLTQPYVAFVGRLIDVKGITTLLEGWSRSDHAGLRLRIGGDGEMRSVVEEYAQRDPSIDYIGWLSEAAVFDFMGAAKAVIVPSHWYEGGVPLVVLRSLAVGTPVIVTDLESICESVLADGAGYCFGLRDPASLADVLTYVSRHDAELAGKRANARASYVARYTPQADLQALETIYREAAENRSPSGRGA